MWWSLFKRDPSSHDDNIHRSVLMAKLGGFLHSLRNSLVSRPFKLF